MCLRTFKSPGQTPNKGENTRVSASSRMCGGCCCCCALHRHLNNEPEKVMIASVCVYARRRAIGRKQPVLPVAERKVNAQIFDRSLSFVDSTRSELLPRAHLCVQHHTPAANNCFSLWEVIKRGVGMRSLGHSPRSGQTRR